MVSTTGGNYHCPSCNAAVDDSVYRPSEWKSFPHEGFGEQKGWICPVCGRGVAPWTSFCPCQSDFKITYGTSTGGDVDLSKYQDMMNRIQKALDDGEIKL
jgi:hypothetical protein